MAVSVMILTAALLCLQVATQPNPTLTPGVVRNMTTQEICSTHWGKDHRHVTVKMRQQVAAAYGVNWEDRWSYEFDHLIPRSLGGADDIKNLWPQPIAEARQKDVDEQRLTRAVCTKGLPLSEAQTMMRQWKVAEK